MGTSGSGSGSCTSSSSASHGSFSGASSSSNLPFAGFFYAIDGRGCGDPRHDLRERLRLRRADERRHRMQRAFAARGRRRRPRLLGRRPRQLPVSFFVLSPRWYFATAGGAGALIADAFGGVGGDDEAPGTDDRSPSVVERTRLRVHARGLPR